jgi:hypothetical protein
VDLTRFRGQLVTVPVFESGMNAYVLIEFMRRLVKDAQRKVQLILDNLQVHHAPDRGVLPAGLFLGAESRRVSKLRFEGRRAQRKAVTRQ